MISEFEWSSSKASKYSTGTTSGAAVDMGPWAALVDELTPDEPATAVRQADGLSLGYAGVGDDNRTPDIAVPSPAEMRHHVSGPAGEVPVDDSVRSAPSPSPSTRRLRKRRGGGSRNRDGGGDVDSGGGGGGSKAVVMAGDDDDIVAAPRPRLDGLPVITQEEAAAMEGAVVGRGRGITGSSAVEEVDALLKALGLEEAGGATAVDSATATSGAGGRLGVPQQRQPGLVPVPTVVSTERLIAPVRQLRVVGRPGELFIEWSVPRQALPSDHPERRGAQQSTAAALPSAYVVEVSPGSLRRRVRRFRVPAVARGVTADSDAESDEHEHLARRLRVSVEGLDDGRAYAVAVFPVDATDVALGPAVHAVGTPFALPGPLKLTAYPRGSEIVIEWTGRPAPYFRRRVTEVRVVAGSLERRVRGDRAWLGYLTVASPRCTRGFRVSVTPFSDMGAGPTTTVDPFAAVNTAEGEEADGGRIVAEMDTRERVRAPPPPQPPSAASQERGEKEEGSTVDARVTLLERKLDGVHSEISLLASVVRDLLGVKRLVESNERSAAARQSRDVGTRRRVGPGIARPSPRPHRLSSPERSPSPESAHGVPTDAGASVMTDGGEPARASKGAGLVTRELHAMRSDRVEKIAHGIDVAAGGAAALSIAVEELQELRDMLRRMGPHRDPRDLAAKAPVVVRPGPTPSSSPISGTKAPVVRTPPGSAAPGNGIDDGPGSARKRATEYANKLKKRRRRRPLQEPAGATGASASSVAAAPSRAELVATLRELMREAWRVAGPGCLEEGLPRLLVGRFPPLVADGPIEPDWRGAVMARRDVTDEELQHRIAVLRREIRDTVSHSPAFHDALAAALVEDYSRDNLDRLAAHCEAYCDLDRDTQLDVLWAAVRVIEQEPSLASTRAFSLYESVWHGETRAGFTAPPARGLHVLNTRAADASAAGVCMCAFFPHRLTALQVAALLVQDRDAVFRLLACGADPYEDGTFMAPLVREYLARPEARSRARHQREAQLLEAVDVPVPKSPARSTRSMRSARSTPSPRPPHPSADRGGDFGMDGTRGRSGSAFNLDLALGDGE